MSNKRVVITGYGIVSCIGNNKEEVLTSLKEVKSGISHCKEYEELGMRSHVHGKPNLNTEEHVDRKILRFMGEGAAYNHIAMQEAIEHSGLDQSLVSNPNTGIVMGSGGPSTYQLQQAFDIAREKGVKKIGPYMVTRTMSSTNSATLAQQRPCFAETGAATSLRNQSFVQSTATCRIGNAGRHAVCGADRLRDTGALLRRKLLVENRALHFHVGAGLLNAVAHLFRLLIHLINPTADETLDGIKGVVWVHHRLTFGDLTHQLILVLGVSNHGGRGPEALGVRDHGGLTALHHGNTAVRSAKVNADNLAHRCPPPEMVI